MTSEEAYKEMEKGNKVTHKYFSSNQYLYLDNKGVIRDEEGYNWSEKDPFPQTPWEEYTEKNKNDWRVWTSKT